MVVPVIKNPIKHGYKCGDQHCGSAYIFPNLCQWMLIGLARSTTASRAEFKNSAIHTMANARKRIAQSRAGSCIHIARMITRVEASIWIQAFFWVEMTYHHPANACLNDFALERKNSIICIGLMGYEYTTMDY